MHEAGGIEQHVDRAKPLGHRLHCRGVARVELRHSATPSSFSPASSASLRSVAITLAPSRASAMAVARPMPAPAAVQNAILPSTRLAIRLIPTCIGSSAPHGDAASQLNVSLTQGQANPAQTGVPIPKFAYPRLPYRANSES